MVSRADDDGDLSKHFVIKNDIVVEFTNPPKTTKLDVIFNNVSIALGEPVTTNDQTYRWPLNSEIRVFPNFDDTLTLRLSYGKKRSGKSFKVRNIGPIEISLAHNHIADKFKESEHMISVSGQSPDWTMRLEAATGSLADIDPTGLLSTLESLLPYHVQGVLESNDNFLHNARPIKSILEIIPISKDALQGIETTIADLGNTHPLAKAVLAALSIPYKVLKNERDYKEKLKHLAEAMLTTCKCLMDVGNHARIASAKELFKSIMKTVRDAALFVEIYQMKSRFRQLVGSQFPTKLTKFVEELDTQKKDFVVAMGMQTAVGINRIESERFLRRRLNPAKLEELGNGCLEKTRVNVLKEVMDWLESPHAPSLLWIVGAPGVGKSTIATTLVTDLMKGKAMCAFFFCKRDVLDLRDPSRIWSTVAYKLADEHDGIAAALVSILKEKSVTPGGHSAFEQLELLVEGMRRVALAKENTTVMIIDALDECDSANDSSWSSFLTSLARWSDLCGKLKLKLIVTSRDRPDIQAALIDTGHQIRLSTGDTVSYDSANDLRIFFEAKFARMREISPSLKNWPSDGDIQKLVKYAAGLFIWAEMVTKYVGGGKAGRNPVKRLEVVLNDIRPESGHQQATVDEYLGRDQVDRLYARILFDALRHSTSEERDMAKRILATVVLAKEPLEKRNLVELLTTNKSDVGIEVAVDATLWELSCIILISDDTYNPGRLRVCHQTFSDFVLSRKRSITAFESIVKHQDFHSSEGLVPEPHSFVLDYTAESTRLALACVNLARNARLLDIEHTRDIPAVFSSIKTLRYALNFWVVHFEDAGCDSSRIRFLKNLAEAKKLAYGCLRRNIHHSRQLLLANEETITLIRCLRGASDFVTMCINDDNADQCSDKQVERCVTELDSRRNLEAKDCTRALDFARGKFQIAMAVSLASDFDGSVHDAASDAFLRKRLEPPDQSVFDGECLPGTRVKVLCEVESWWAESESVPNAQNVLWIFGAPGAGKSAIAATLFRKFSEKGLCAKVVAKRDIASRRDPLCICRTLAYHLASLHIGLKGSIMEMLSSGTSHNSQNTSVKDQFNDLIIKPLRDQQYLSLIVVIDALDECSSGDDDQWSELLRSFAHWNILPRSIKLVVTSRDIPAIRTSLEMHSYHISLAVDRDNDTSFEEAKSDTRLFYRAMFANLHPYWLSNAVIWRLAERTAGSFIFSKMVVDLVKLNPYGHLQDIFNANGNNPNNVGDVDLLYGKVLYNTLGDLDETDRNAARSILAAILLAKDPLRKEDFAQFRVLSADDASMNETHQSVESVVGELSSILSVDSSQRLRVPHKAFADFLLDHDRSSATMRRLVPEPELHSYLIHKGEVNADFAVACLRLMDSSLRFNACGIKSSHYLNYKIQQLEEFRSRNGMLIYACRFWAEHLKEASLTIDQHINLVRPLITSLLHKNAMYWLEILSLTSAISSVKQSLRAVVQYLQKHNDNSELADVANDVNTFVTRFEEPIAGATTHIYLSVLPFCPPTSWMAQNYGPQYTNLFTANTTVQKSNWDSDASDSSSNLRNTSISDIVFFPDGRKLASVSANGTVHIWDCKTGKLEISILHTRAYTIAISPDGNRVVSGGQDGILRIWNSETGARMLEPIQAHQNVISSVAFSPDNTFVVSAGSSIDCTVTVKVWNSTTGDLCLGPLRGLGTTGTFGASRLGSVAFSPSGKYIASESNQTICIWDASTGGSFADPLIGHTDFITRVVFSADGHYLASALLDGTVCVWDVIKGFTPIRTGTIPGVPCSISFSSNFNLLASGYLDGTFRLWNFSNGKLEELGDVISGHRDTEYVWSLRFSPDDLSICTCPGSSGRSIKLWTVPTISPTQLPASKPAGNSSTGESPYDATALDRHGCPVLSDASYIDKSGWVWDSRGNNAKVLFWVPKENRAGFWWPRNTAVIHEIVTRIDFSRFVHGDSWAECRAPDA